MILKNFLPEYYCEIDYLSKVISILYDKFDDNYELYIFCSDSHPSVEKNDKFKIVIHPGNETYFDTRDYDKVDVVFRYYNSHMCDNTKIFSIPIGYNSSGKNEINFENLTPIADRTNDVFFIGQKNHRHDFINYVNISDFKENVIFSAGFRNGFEIYDYYNQLNNSKICLVPRGLSRETFRYIEAFASGCIVITAEKLNTWYYEESPAIFIKNWDITVDSIIKNLLKSDLSELQKNGLEYYEKFLSPVSIANYITNTIKKIKCQK